MASAGPSLLALTHRLESGLVPLSELRALLHAVDGGARHAALLYVARCFRAGDRDPEALASALPADVSDFEPESLELLADLAVEGLEVPVPSLPAEVPLGVALAWLKAELVVHPEQLARHEGSSLLHHALAALPVERVITTGLLDTLCARGRLEAPDYVRAGLKAGLLAAGRAQRLIQSFLPRANEAGVIGALELLTEPWLDAGDWTPVRARDLPTAVRESEPVLSALMQLYRVRRALEEVRRLIADVPLETGILALGECGDANDLETVLSLLETSVEQFGASGLRALVELKRRGVSASDDQARRVVRHYLAAAHLDAADTAHALESRADAVLRELDAPSPELHDPARVVALLEAIGTRAARERLREIVRAGTGEVLRCALTAIGRLQLFEAEGDVLARLDDEPEVALECLLQIGARATLAALRARLTISERPYWLGKAATVLLALDPSSALLHQLHSADLLDGSVLGALSGVSDAANSELIDAIAGTPGHPLRADAARVLGRSGGPLALTVLSRLLTERDPALRDGARAAIRELGRRLAEQDASRPACLRAAADPGAAALADSLLVRLSEPQLDTESVCWLLDGFPAVAHPRLVPVVRPYLRHADPEIKKRAVSCLIAGGARAATWLAPWLTTDDVTIARQVLIALGELGASFAADVAARWLDHANMNLKKTAARTLGQAKSRSAIPKLLFWLGAHDNPGFRELLTEALQATLGEFYVGALLDAAERAESPRARQLLLRPLRERLRAADVAAIVAARPGGNFDLELAGVEPGELDAQLRRRGLRSRTPVSLSTLEPHEQERASAQRNTRELRRCLRALPESAPELTELVRRASSSGKLAPFQASRAEALLLLDRAETEDATTRRGALSLLSGAAPVPLIQQRIAALLSASPIEQVPAELALGTRSRWTVRAARFWLTSDSAAVRSSAATLLLTSTPIEPLAFRGVESGRVIRELFARGLAHEGAGYFRETAQQLLEALQNARRFLGPSAALALWRSAIESAGTPLASELPGLLARLPCVLFRADDEWLRLAQSNALGDAVRQSAALQLASSDVFPVRLELLRVLSRQAPTVVRERAALRLFALGTPRDRDELAARIVAGDFRNDFSLPVRMVPAPSADGDGDEARLRRVRLLARSPTFARVAPLFEAWRDAAPEVTRAARDALRALPFDVALAFAEPLLLQGDYSVLDALGGTRLPPMRLLAALARAADDWPACLEFLERCARLGSIFAPGLLALSIQRATPATLALSFRVALALSEFQELERIESLASLLAPLLELVERERSLALLAEASAAAQYPAIVRVRLLSALSKPTDEVALRALADHVIARPRDRASLRPELATAVDRIVRRDATEGPSERARAALGYLSLHVRGPELVDLLEAASRHRSAKVRLKAHRLLRKHATRERYLEVTRGLLADTDTNIVRSAIRTLGFGGDVHAAGLLVNALFHTSGVVQSSAREGLLALGARARPALLHALGSVRPDRRAPIAAVLAELEPE